jgi:hypothetical protein
MKNDFLCQEQCCQIFLGAAYQNRKNVPNNYKMYQIAIKYTKWLQNLPNGRKIYQNHPSQDPPKFTQIWIFGLKICHLATLDSGTLIHGFSRR